ncbi:hypothetical protein OC846_003643 [Tilletia horrida]|uniref:Uncharacterized protein n=1 Tax=Tilletia horrida TaxID=155126 RepID=A0AAN6GS31_9BASI|nr:hypothetical protein OC845_004283 [Tilletia horrida]KAK0550446.1 hypothetical protein OC846_003643 [Tilletia horrida]KAK0564122.1 hypothetical protein OC861_004473 [Tilletia horrida]
MGDTQRLPMEIILHIIDSFIDNPRAIYSPSDDVTKTLLSFTLVCRATYAHASNHLRRQCMFVDTEDRMKRCIYYLKATNHLVPEYNLCKIDDFQVSPPRVRLCPVPSRYLAITRSAERQLYDRSMTDSSTELLTLIRPGLKRLILDISFDCYCAPNGWGNVFPHPGQSSSAWPSFVAAFSSLTELEEVVSLQDSTYFPCLEISWGIKRPVWALWPNLRRFALYAADTDYTSFWQNTRRAETLELLILGSPRTIRSCLKTAYLQPGPSDTEATKPPTPLKIVFAAAPQHQPRSDSGRCCLPWVSNWPSVDPDNLITVSLHDLPPPAQAWSPRSEAREHMRTAALRDEIWDWQGEIVS